jgi:L-ascorbate metabolism protein UlaG (beta-lactamase superfamily)
MKSVHTRSLLALILLQCCFPVSRICHAQAACDSLTYYGHSFVKIKTAQGMVIYIDPFDVNAYADSADAVLITHEHSDHNDIGRVRQKPACRIIRAADAVSGNAYAAFAVGPVTIQGFPAYNSYHAKASSVGFIVSFNGIKLYHAGDTGSITEMADLTGQHITYALLPMDGVYTMTPEAATAAAATIQAVHDIPIHTMPPPDTYSDAIVGRFASPNKLALRPGSTIDLAAAVTGVAGTAAAPAGFRLDQNYPNPFNPSTRIAFNTPARGFVSLNVFDLLGRKVAALVSEDLSAGAHTIEWTAIGMPSGAYFYTLEAGGCRETKRLIILK